MAENSNRSIVRGEDMRATAGWEVCPERTLRDLAGRRKATRTRRTAVATAGLGLLACLALWASPGSPPAGAGGLTCSDCIAAREGYLAGSLPPGRVEAVETHLAACPLCTRAFAAAEDPVTASNPRPPFGRIVATVR